MHSAAHAGTRRLALTTDEQHRKTPTQLEVGDRDCPGTSARGIRHICPRPKPHYDLPGIGLNRRLAETCTLLLGLEMTPRLCIPFTQAIGHFEHGRLGRRRPNGGQI